MHSRKCHTSRWCFDSAEKATAEKALSKIEKHTHDLQNKSTCASLNSQLNSAKRGTQREHKESGHGVLFLFKVVLSQRTARAGGPARAV